MPTVLGRPVLGEISGNASNTSVSAVRKRRGPKRKTIEERASIWVMPPQLKCSKNFRSNRFKIKVIMFHYCHQIPVFGPWNNFVGFRSPTLWEVNRYFSVSTKSVSTVQKWIKERLDILQAPAMSKTSRIYWAPNWPEMEDSLHKLFLKYRAEGRLIRQSFFRYHATRLFGVHYPLCTELFHFSNGWFAGFLKRKEISIRTVSHTVNIC